MRKLIVKFLALDYVVQIYGTTFNFVRAANIIFPLSCLIGSMSVKNNRYPVDNIFSIILLIILLIIIVLSFVYLMFYPEKWDELDNSQKWQYGIRNYLVDTEQQKEWLKIVAGKKNYNSMWVLFVNPITIIITFIYLLL